MKVIEKLKSLIWRRPLTEEELAARADVERMREQARNEAAEFALRDRRF
jgi:hypothetical protein